MQLQISSLMKKIAVVVNAYYKEQRQIRTNGRSAHCSSVYSDKYSVLGRIRSWLVFRDPMFLCFFQILVH